MRAAFLACLLAASLSCALARSTENEPLVAADLESFQPGVTTARQVVERLGAPVEVVQLGKRSAYRYQFTATKRAGLWLVVVGLYSSDTRSDRAWVFFDESEVLSHVGMTLDGADPRYVMPWTDPHEEDAPDEDTPAE